MNEQLIESDIRRLKLTAARVTPEQVDYVIAAEQYHVFEGSCLTVCCLTLRNGFTVTGESACASPANFDAELGKKIARGKARDKVWLLEGYLLKQSLFEAGRPTTAPARVLRGEGTLAAPFGPLDAGAASVGVPGATP